MEQHPFPTLQQGLQVATLTYLLIPLLQSGSGPIPPAKGTGYWYGSMQVGVWG